MDSKTAFLMTKLLLVPNATSAVPAVSCAEAIDVPHACSDGRL